MVVVDVGLSNLQSTPIIKHDNWQDSTSFPRALPPPFAKLKLVSFGSLLKTETMLQKIHASRNRNGTAYHFAMRRMAPFVQSIDSNRRAPAESKSRKSFA